MIRKADLLMIPVMKTSWVLEMVRLNKYIEMEPPYRLSPEEMSQLLDEYSLKTTRKKIVTQQKRIKQKQNGQKEQNKTDIKKKKKKKASIFNDLLENMENPESMLLALNTMYGLEECEEEDKRLLAKARRVNRKSRANKSKIIQETIDFENFYTVGYQGKLSTFNKLNQVKENLRLTPATNLAAFKFYSLFIKENSISGSAGYIYALANNVPIVDENWVQSCISANEFLPFKKFQKKIKIDLKIFEGKKIGIFDVEKDQLVSKESIQEEKNLFYKSILEVVERSGGTFCEDRPFCRVMIIPPKDYERLKDHKEIISLMSNIVKTEWLADSIDQQIMRNPLNDEYCLNKYRFGKEDCDEGWMTIE